MAVAKRGYCSVRTAAASWHSVGTLVSDPSAVKCRPKYARRGASSSMNGAMPASSKGIARRPAACRHRRRHVAGASDRCGMSPNGPYPVTKPL